MPSSFEEQIELLESLKKHLSDFAEYIKAAKERNTERILELHREGGLMVNPFRKFKEQSLDLFSDNVNDLLRQIHDIDIPLLEKYIRFFEDYER